MPWLQGKGWRAKAGSQNKYLAQHEHFLYLCELLSLCILIAVISVNLCFDIQLQSMYAGFMSQTIHKI